MLTALFLASACGNDSNDAGDEVADSTEAGTTADGTDTSDTSSETEGDTGVDDSICATQYAWEAGVGDFTSFPTAEMMVADPSTSTGWRVAITEADFPGVAEFKQHAGVVSGDMNSLDGFGIQGDVFFGFEGTFDPALLPADATPASADAPAGIVVMPEAGDPYLAAVGFELTDEGSTLMFHPLFPLPEGTQVASWVKRDVAAAGNCIGASPSMRAMLDTAEAENDPALAALVSLGVVDDADGLAVLHSYPTQTATELSKAVAAYIAALPDDGRFDLTDHACEMLAEHTKCTSNLAAQEFRNADGVVDWHAGDTVTAQADWTLIVHAWLPGDGTDGPYPTVLFGHGLNQSATDGDKLAESLNPLGIAVVGISAVMHGDHPSVETPLNGLAATLAFFGVDVNDATIDILRIRGHLRQSAFDKLFVTRALLAGADLDGDGNVDADVDQLAYFGSSLGGIMGVELLAHSDVYGAASLNVPGGRLTMVMATPDTAFEAVKSIILPLSFSEGTSRRLFAIAQTLLDAGDPSSYADALIQAPYAGVAPKHVLMTAVIGDDTVPNPANWSIARSLGIPLVADELVSVVGVALAGPVPVSNNFEGVTAGMLQFDVLDSQGTLAGHSTTVYSDLGVAAWSHFFDTYFSTGTPEIIDPYAELGIPHAG